MARLTRMLSAVALSILLPASNAGSKSPGAQSTQIGPGAAGATYISLPPLKAHRVRPYRYVKNRAELDDFLFDHLMADCSAKLVGKDWRAHLRSIANAWRARLVGKRDVTRIAINQVSIGPNVLPLMEASLSALRKSGLNDRDLIEAYQTCVLFVHSFATSEASYKSLLARNDGSAPRFSPIKPEWIKPFPTLASLAAQMARPVDFDRRFAFGLNVIIAGIEQQALRK